MPNVTQTLKRAQRNWLRGWPALFCILAAGFPSATIRHCGAAETPSALQLTLPTEFSAVVDHEMNVYFDNIVLTQTPTDYRFKVDCPIGRTAGERWTLTPSVEDVGTHEFTVTVTDKENHQIATASTSLLVVPADAGADRRLRLLIVGDSLTHATLYPNEIARLLSQPGNPEWEMLGTHKPARAAEGVAHEGYGGWTWQRFAAHYEPNPDGTYKKRSSPFVFGLKDGKPMLDVERYFDEACDGKRPDVVFFLLGINDCFSADADDPQAIDARVNTMLTQAETLLAAFREAAPQADLAICLTTPPNAREEGFEANYKGRYHRWGWKRIQHRLVQRELAHFAGRESQRQFIVPTQLNLDPFGGYPVNNGVHPNALGYQQIGQSLYAWLKTQLARP